MERNRYPDLLRVVAIGGVVYGHWLLVDVTYSSERLSGLDAVDYCEPATAQVGHMVRPLGCGCGSGG
jgi:hypothetical protein